MSRVEVSGGALGRPVERGVHRRDDGTGVVWKGEEDGVLTAVDRWVVVVQEDEGRGEGGVAAERLRDGGGFLAPSWVRRRGQPFLEHRRDLIPPLLEPLFDRLFVTALGREVGAVEGLAGAGTCESKCGIFAAPLKAFGVVVTTDEHGDENHIEGGDGELREVGCRYGESSLFLRRAMDDEPSRDRAASLSEFMLLSFVGETLLSRTLAPNSKASPSSYPPKCVSSTSLAPL